MFALRQFGKLGVWIAVLALIVSVSCSRPVAVQGTAGTRVDAPQAPFDGRAESTSTNSSQEFSAYDNSSQHNTGVPFRDPNSLPVGTLLTVRLDKAITADSPDANGTFEAIVDEAVVVNGVTLVPRGASAVGRVESARASRLKRNRSYVRMTLATIDVGGKDFPIQTSSLFAKGRSGVAANAKSSNCVRLDKGRQLTFRLTGSVFVASERPFPTH